MVLVDGGRSNALLPAVGPGDDQSLHGRFVADSEVHGIGMLASVGIPGDKNSDLASQPRFNLDPGPDHRALPSGTEVNPQPVSDLFGEVWEKVKGLLGFRP